MKNIQYIVRIAGVLLLLSGLTWSCREGIDPISAVDPGPDQGAPVVTIQFPANGSKIQVLEAVTTVNIKFEATDDIEIAAVKVNYDGSEIASFDDFKDYRRFLGDFDYDQVTNGTHELTVTATDLSGKSTSASVTFEKEAPYEPLYAGEMLYMPFDNDFIDLVNIARPEVVGNPGFSAESMVGLGAYAGAQNSYLTFPGAPFQQAAFSAAFWMQVNDSPDRAGILVMGAPDEANPDAANNRTYGFRFFRENAGGMQRFKLNVGTGATDSWFDGGASADVTPNTGEWVHFAFTISSTRAAVYINGEIAKTGALGGVSWEGCDLLSIMSGAPRFTGWNHRSDESLMDELRLFNRELSQAEIQQLMQDESGLSAGYTPVYEGETFYMSFDDAFTEKVSGAEPTVIGAPERVAGGVLGMAYQGAADAYLTFPTEGLTGAEFSASFWHKTNDAPDRAGILVAGPPDAANPDAAGVRTAGFRFFRENAGGLQRFKLNVGTGASDSWFDGGANADVEPNTGVWNHFAFSIAGDHATVYLNGEVISEGDYPGIDWTDCDVFSIMSGAPRFTVWDHYSDQGQLDELRLFNKALSQAEVQQIIADVQ